MYMDILPQLLISFDVPRCKQTDTREAEVLVLHKALDRHHIGVTTVVDEPGDVAISTGVNTVDVSILARQGQNVINNARFISSQVFKHKKWHAKTIQTSKRP